MDKHLLTDALSGSRDRAEPARALLVEQGAEAVAAVLDVLCDEHSPVDWTVPADILRGIGEPALLPLAQAVATAASPEVARRAGWTLARLDVADPKVYAPLLGHPDARVRTDALIALGNRGDTAASIAHLLVPSLGDPEPEVRRQAVRAFEAIGTAAVPELRRVRRARASGPRIRAGALEALAAVGGPAALDPTDQEAWRRLTRIGLRTETPQGMHLCGSWYAVPGTDQDAVLDAFDLGEAHPVTLRTGAAAWNHDQHAWHRTRPHEACARVFVSPVLDGWTLVFGDSSQDRHRVEDADDREEVLAEVVRQRCAALSRRFGSAQWYGMSCGDGWTAWCIAEEGEVVRHYDVFTADEEGDEGTPHPAESGYLLPHEDGFPEDAFDGVNLSDTEEFAARHREVKERLRIPDTCNADDIAARLSVDPQSLDARTRVTGHGVLALTACGREHGHPAGALPV
ncbi:HEAT repeat domain-containing protein [Streptomyces sp. NBC_00820]|uniref:HEAT repeat domain-containing protein n=1 Tax=Streptomyces sp. NBC_00820 TaxID=2975842 RepID=UPI002ED3E6C9|nr:HEAT repeat domain-containing protein [Streptomyces sp. NBC_00820]